MPADTPTDRILAFRDALSDDARARLHITKSVEYNITRATDEHGWTVQQLATECNRNLHDVANIGGVITERLRIAATVAPPRQHGRNAGTRPFCSPECRDNQGWVLDGQQMPHHRCPCRMTTREATDR